MRRWGPWLAALWLAFALGVPSGAVSAKTILLRVDYGTPTARAAFGQGIDFSIPVTLGTPVDRVELELRFPSSLGPWIVELEPPTGTGSHELRHRWSVGLDGHVVPNTTIRARWVVRTADDGTTVASPEVAVTYADTRFTWQTRQRGVMRVHWYEGGAAFGGRALEIGEAAVEETAALLGVTESEAIDFFIYADERAFRDALGPGTRENVGGQAHADIRTLFALITPSSIDDAWVAIVIPHELVHLVFDTAVENPFRFPPRWLNEGLAVYLSEGYGPGDRRRVERAAADGTLMPLPALVGQFPTDVERTFLAYAESASAVDHLVRRHGRDALVSLVLAYREGLTDDEAFTAAIGEDVETFQAGWLDELGAAEPIRYGPHPAPPGPLPPGWAGAGATPLPVETPGAVATPDRPSARPTAGPGTGPPGAPGSTSGEALAVLLGAAAAGVVLALVSVRRSRRRGGVG